MENRNGLVIDVSVTEANGFAEREAALEMLARTRERHELEPLTLGADKGYAAGGFLVALEEEQGIVPLIPMPAIPVKGSSKGARARRRARRRRTSKQFKLAQKVRKRVEEIIGWDKVVGGMRRSRHVGRWKITQQVLLVNSAYNLIRMARLGAQAA